jgi:tRNA-dihydrouridine synthase B
MGNRVKPLPVGGIELPGNILAAPLAGITDYPLRRIARKFGASLTVSEMISSQALVRKSGRSVKMADSAHEEFPLSVQISGSDPDIMARAAAMNESFGAAIIDINMGCPQRKIVRTGAGAALMKDMPLAGRIINRVVRTVSVPVTVKMRLGWDHHSINAVEFARMAEAEGASMIVVHGRTRKQMFAGEVDWKTIKKVKEEVRCPVIANGDIRTCDDARRAIEESGADGIMIGRAMLGRPWIFTQVREYLETGRQTAAPPLEEQYHVAAGHLEGLFSFYGEPVCVWLARKHLAWYTKGMRGSAAFRQQLNKAKAFKEVAAMLENFYADLLSREWGE